MSLSARSNVLSLLILTAPLAACARPADPAPAAPVAAVPAVAQSSAPQLVSGLPDFTHLVEQVGPGVVNIEAKIGSRPASSADGMDEQEIPESSAACCRLASRCPAPAIAAVARAAFPPVRASSFPATATC